MTINGMHGMSEPKRIDSATLSGFERSADPGCFEIIDHDFDDDVFERISVGPGLPPERYFRLKNTRFRRCKIVAGELVVRGGVELRQVEFDSVSSKDSLTISTNAVLDGVVVKGHVKTGGLWIRPDEVLDLGKHALRQKWVANLSRDIPVMVDFAGFNCENIEVIGLPIGKLRFDPDRHVAIRDAWRQHVDLSAFSPVGFFRSALRRLKTFGAAEGVFASPSSDSDRLAEFRHEARRLLDAGIDTTS